MKRPAAPASSPTPYRDDREALRARVAALEAELAALRHDSGLDRLRGELAAAQATIARLIRAALVSRGVHAEGLPQVITWHFCVENTGATTIRLVGGQTDWCIEQPASDGGTTVVRLLETPEKNQFGDRPELQPGHASDDYKVHLDTDVPALRQRLDRLGMDLATAIDQIQPLVRVEFESVDIAYSDAVEGILEP